MRTNTWSRSTSLPTWSRTRPAGYQSGTLVHAMMFHCQKLSSSDDPVRPGIVHRLDKDTTGVIVVAKDDEAHWRLALQFERRKIHKEYLAVVEGEFELDSDRIDAPIGAHPSVRERYSVRKEIGRPAATVYQVIERLKGLRSSGCCRRRGGRISFASTCRTCATRSSPTPSTAAAKSPWASS